MPALRPANILFLIAAAMLLMNCKKSSTAQTTCSVGCPAEGICTDEFRSVSVTIQHTDGRPLRLDRYYTVTGNSQAVIDLQSGLSEYEDSIHQTIGQYPVLNDQHKNLTDRCGKTFYFVGIKDSMEVIREAYVVAHDCCHIALRSGGILLVR